MLWRIFSIIVILGVFAWLIVENVWPVRLSILGYEFTSSIFVLIAALFILLYVIYLIRQPMVWIKEYKANRRLRAANQVGSFWQLILITILDKNNKHIDDILKKKKNFVDKNGLEDLLIESIFKPSSEVFEKLSAFERTKLAGMRGLILEARKKGDLTYEARLLERAWAEFPDVAWILRDLMSVQVLQGENRKARETLEKLYKNKWVDKEEYRAKKAEISFALKEYKEAYGLEPGNTVFALAYAKTVPNKAQRILEKIWEQNAEWDVYAAYKRTLAKLPVNKQMRAIEKFTNANKQNGLYLVAQADSAMDAGLWGVAKENLDAYLGTNLLTRHIAEMMEKIERDGYHHPEKAKEWSDKAVAM